MKQKRMKVCVIGSGVNGLISAYCIANCFPHCDITIISADQEMGKCSKHGFGSVMITRPLRIMDSVDTLKYTQQTREYCQNMNQEDAKAAGIQRLESFSLFNFHQNEETAEKGGDSVPTNEIANLFKSGENVRQATNVEMREAGFVADNTKLAEVMGEKSITKDTLEGYIGYHYIVDTNLYLPWLRHQLTEMAHSTSKEKRVTFVDRKITSWNDIGLCDLIINCSGLGARELCDDPFVIPIRGQYLSVSCPLKRCYRANHFIIVPRTYDTVIGGSYQIGRWDQQIDPKDTEKILRDAAAVYPEVTSSDIKLVDVGVRPGRIGGPRIEIEYVDVKNVKSKVPVIHNYGHGARGFTLFWGCAERVAQLASGLFLPHAKL
ncbi:D-aspartate oxidase-like isoform X1 [Clavelina lepadiformis]|uniref:D-aspartate oxidase-like isoform X1 n=3 Tax=Clavelina lepadiformis TaxID=159417 RepID=UPI004041A552